MDAFGKLKEFDDCAGMVYERCLPCDLRGWAALYGAGEHDGHVLPDGVGPQRDGKVRGLLTEKLQVLDVCGGLFLCLKSQRGGEVTGQDLIKMGMITAVWLRMVTSKESKKKQKKT